MVILARAGQRCRMFCMAVCRFRELKAFEASTIKTQSDRSSSKQLLTACIAASTPEGCPTHSWREPVPSKMSWCVMDRTAFAMMRLTVLHMPIGQIPGFLSSATKWQARRGERPLGSTYTEHSFLASRDKEWQRSSKDLLNAEHSLLQQWASVPDGSPAPVVWRAARRMRWASRRS